jgi:RNA polymerase nonessential primary-like sigma factor
MLSMVPVVKKKPSALVEAQARAIVARYQAGDRADRSSLADLIPLYEQFIWSTAFGVANRSRLGQDRACVEELAQEGHIGLLRAAELFDLTRVDPKTGRPIRFLTYASHWIFQAVTRAATQQSLIRVPVFAHPACGGSTRSRPLSGGIKASVEAAMGLRAHGGTDDLADSCPVVGLAASPAPCEAETADEVAYVNALCDALPAREREIVMRRYGLRGHEPHTLLELAEVLGVSRESVRQIQANAEHRLRVASEARRGQ